MCTNLEMQLQSMVDQRDLQAIKAVHIHNRTWQINFQQVLTIESFLNHKGRRRTRQMEFKKELGSFYLQGEPSFAWQWEQS